ncbi:MAG TPA: hypothetical protein ENJ44_01315 [Oceanospirillales bacterium]|nr:hypothetical protein [Oceanospirillales bacterium]
MKLVKKIIFASFLTVSLVTVSQAAPTADEIVAKNVEAKGGAAKWDAIKTIKIKGKMNMGQMVFPFEMIQKRPNKLFMTFEVQGMQGKQVFDGEKGWMVMPFMGKTDPEPMADDQLKDFRKQADIDGPLRSYKKNGNKLEYIGETEIEGTPVIELKLTEKEGDITTFYLEKDSLLEIKTKTKATRMGQTMEIETTIGNYDEVDGLVFPHSISTSLGNMGGQEIILESIEINQDVDDKIFQMPKAKPVADKEEKKKVANK